MLKRDQTLSKYVTVEWTTMTPQNSMHLGLASSTDMSYIMFTLTVTLDRKVLLFQIINGGKTNELLPEGFGLNVNEKQNSKTEKMIVIPYVKEDQFALLI